ncbi:CCL3 protein, partial [Calyptomena viridis]|nr:CCL3 protein [Calyptomena viridis]
QAEPLPQCGVLLGLSLCPHSGHPLVCCFNYISRPVPHRLITSAYRTSKSCPKPAVILVTKKGMSLCADPEAPWVQKYLQDSEI